ncbi:MAG: glycosyltransferase family 39 protein [Verrucomicrobia bacterium]|nr:glycosyltransferase family 39 protein [Verrucomicrobiota bacterium]
MTTLVQGVKSSRSSLACALLFALAFAVVAVATLPLRTAFEIGGDEGYELMKGLLCSQGYQLYAPVWNDQPPLHTALLSALFRAFGPSAFAGRLLTLGFASVLLAALLASVGTREGTMAALIAGGFLLGMPFFLMLSVSVMLEIPAFAVGLVSAWLLVQWVERERWTWLALSGAFMGAALMIKLTVALLLPGMVVEIVLAGWRSKSEARATTIMRMLAVWAAVTALVVAGAVWFSPGMTFGQIIGNHFNQALRAATAGNPGMTFSFTGLWSVFTVCSRPRWRFCCEPWTVVFRAFVCRLSGS